METVTLILYFILSYQVFIIYILSLLLLKCGNNINQVSISLHNDLMIIKLVSIISNLCWDKLYHILNKYYLLNIIFRFYNYVNLYFKKIQIILFTKILLPCESYYINDEHIHNVDIKNILSRKPPMT